jgi:hypothetical protein
MSTKTRLGWIAVVVSLPLLAGCPSPVDPNTPDSSPPTVSLDAFGIPVQPGASSQPNPESIDVSCCDVTRLVKPGSIDLLAAGTDMQSGIKSASIWVTNDTTFCMYADGTLSHSGPAQSGSPAAKVPTSPPATSPTAPNRLLASYSLKIAGRPSACVSYEASWDVYAEGTNSAGLTAKTKKFHLRYRVP